MGRQAVRLTLERRKQLWNNNVQGNWRVANLENARVYGDNSFLYSYNTVLARRLNYVSPASIVVDTKTYSPTTSKHVSEMHSVFGINSYSESFTLLNRFMNPSNYVPTKIKDVNNTLCMRSIDGLSVYKIPNMNVIKDGRNNKYYLIVDLVVRSTSDGTVAFKLTRRPSSIVDALEIVFGRGDVLMYGPVAFVSPIDSWGHKLSTLSVNIPWVDKSGQGYLFVGKGVKVGGRYYFMGGGIKTYSRWSRVLKSTRMYRRKNDVGLLWELVKPRVKSYIELY